MRIKLLWLICFTFIGFAQAINAQYCDNTTTPAPYSTGCTSDDYMQSFSTSGGATNISNLNTGCDGGAWYHYYSNQTHTAVQNTQVNFSILNGPDWSGGYKIWVDWDNNGSFATSELVWESPTTLAAGGSTTGNFLIPMTVTPGMKRMRVRMVFSSTTFDACNAVTYGEIEDYNLNVIASTPCNGTPNAGTAQSSITNILCPNAQFTLSLSGSSLTGGLAYQWQTSTDNVNWTNITGATGFTYSTTHTNPVRYYRARVICTNTNDTAFSGSVAVTNGSGPTYAALPFTENFENAWMNTCNTREIPNNSWRNTPGTGDASWRRNDDGAAASWSTPATGAYTPAATLGLFSARFHSTSTLAGTIGTLDMYLNCNTGGNTKRLKFDAINLNGLDSIRILLSTNGGSSYVRLDSVGTTAGWRTKSVVFSSNSATTVIRFMAFGDDGTSDIGIDNAIVTEFEDCSGTPAGGTASTNLNNVCVSDVFTLSVTGATDAAGLVYQWEKADSLASGTFGPFTPIAGANNTSYSLTQGVTTKYRLKITCTLNGNFAYSTEVTVKSPPILNGDYFINKNAPASELWPLPGKNTFLSFNAAKTAMSCGIAGNVNFNVVVGSGPYTEQLLFTANVPGASATRKVTFNGNGETLQFAGTSAERAVIKLNNTDHIRFHNLVINQTATAQGFGVQIMNNADSNVVSNCVINLPINSTSTNFAGIVINSSASDPIGTGTTLSDSNTIINNRIVGGYYGITLAGTLTGASGENYIAKNDIRDFHMYGMYFTGTYSTYIDSNTISRPTRTTVGNFIGVHFTGPNFSATLTRTRIHNPFSGAPGSTATFTGINFASSVTEASLPITVSNNLIHGVNGNGVKTGIDNNTSSNLFFFHNTINLDTITAANINPINKGYNQNGNADVFFFNNIVTVTPSSSGAKYAIYLASASTLFESDRNVLWVQGTNSHIGYVGGNKTTMAQWQATGRDPNSFNTQPAYIAPEVGDLTPQNQQIDNMGVGQLGVFEDYFGQARVNQGVNPPTDPGPDPGAIEFIPPYCQAPAKAGVTRTSTVDICWGRDIILGLDSNSYGLTQTYQWQVASAGNPGVWNNLGAANFYPDTLIVADTPIWVRAVVTCGTSQDTSNPIFIQVTAPLFQGTYTINANQPTSYTQGNGNFNSFNDAKTAMKCGITGPIVFQVQQGLPANGGDHFEQVRFNWVFNSSPTNTITFKGNNNTIRFASANSNERAVIKLDSAKYFIFDSLRIDAESGTYGYGIQLMNDADSNVFRNGRISVSTTSTSTTNYAAIVLNASNNILTTNGQARTDENLFENNQVIGGGYGVVVVGGTGASAASEFITGNKFINNEISDFYSHGIYISGTTGTLVDRNSFSRRNRILVPTTTYAIQASGAASDNLVISRNRFTRMFAAASNQTGQFYGIHFNSVDANTKNHVVNNAFYGLDGGGAQYALYNVGSDNVNYYHNTISLDNQLATPTNAATAGFWQTTKAVGISFKNNIITVRRNTTGTKHAVYMQAADSEIEFSNNNYFVAGNNSHIGFKGGNRTTMADWVANSTETNSHNFDPIYEDTATGNLKPQLLPLNDKGTNVNVAVDILGNTRPAFGGTAPDIGAFEFFPPACANPLVAGKASVTPAGGLCLEEPITLTVTGHSPPGTITFQWQYATSANGPWMNLSDERFNPTFDTLTTTENYYRAVVRCNGVTVYTDTIMLNLNMTLPAGTYTIDSTQATQLPPVPGSNFRNFTDVAAVLNCGIGGKVTFNVKQAPGGVYREQIRIGRVRGSSDVKTITFQSETGNPALAVLTYDSATNVNNYTLKLDSASNIIFKNMTINATNHSGNSTLGRAIEFGGTASNDSILNCIINVPAYNSTQPTIAGIYGNQLRGGNISLIGNTISGGAMGIYMAGVSNTILTPDNLIVNNTIDMFGNAGIYVTNQNRLTIDGNNINVTSPLTATSYGIYTNYNDSAFKVTKNNVNINNTVSGTVHGLYLLNSRVSQDIPGLIHGNKVIADSNNAAILYGIHIIFNQGTQTHHHVLNNVVALRTTSNTSYGLYANNSANGRYYNNSINNVSNGTTTSYAAYFANTSASGIDVRNNIFSHKGAGRALYYANSDNAISDYNMLYKGTGTHLVARGTPNVGGTVFTDLLGWRAAAYRDFNSISEVEPAWVSETDLTPNISKDSVWAIHGRGVQIREEGFTNNYDINGNYRADTIINGVPDLGAYEFAPPPVLPAALMSVITTTPTADAIQAWMFGTDTVAKIYWGTQVPADITVRRYSGVKGAGMTADQINKSMYFYVDIDVPNALASTYHADTLQVFYIDSWQGHLESLLSGGMARTTRDGPWGVIQQSTIETVSKTINSNTQVTYLDKFTGMFNPFAPPVLNEDSSNRGRQFWVGYGHHQFFSGNTQNMVLYLSAQEPAFVQLKSNTGWIRNYYIPANTVKVSDFIPKDGVYDTRLMDEGFWDRGISISSNVPIEAYAHIYGSTNSGASMLMPVGTWGYDYYTLNTKQYYASDCYSWFYVVADKDNTVVGITPSVNTKGGKPANQEFFVTLNKGQIYQVMGTTSGSAGTDVTGSRARSVPNSDGECHPIAMFSGSSRTAICYFSNGDNYNEQVFPYQAWGKRYAMFATANSNSNTNYNANIYRVMVRDPNTVVKKNNVIVPQSQLQFGRYYEFSTPMSTSPNNIAMYIEADKPVMVSQIMISTSANECPGLSATGNGDPEIAFIAPFEQGIRKTIFYNTGVQAIVNNYVNVVIDTQGYKTLKIDNITSGFTHVFDHPYLPGYKCVRQNLPGAAGQHIITSDSAFTATTYGLGSAESYFYNAGTLVRSLVPKVKVLPDSLPPNVEPPTWVCEGSPFSFEVYIPLKVDTLIWHFSKVPGLSVNVDSTQAFPVPKDSILIGSIWYYIYSVQQSFTFSTQGQLALPVTFMHPEIESCDKTFRTYVNVQVTPRPDPNFTMAFGGCLGDTAFFHALATTGLGQNVYQYQWDLMDNDTTSMAQDTFKVFQTPGTKDIKLHVWTYDGCFGDTTKQLVVNPLPVVEMVDDSVRACYNSQAILDILNPVAGTTYQWYDSPTGGSLVNTGSSLTIANLTADTTFYIVAISDSGCTSTGWVQAWMFVDQLPVVNFTNPTVAICSGGDVSISVDNPAANTNYNWYDAATGGNLLFTGPVYVQTGVTAPATYYVEAVTTAGCTSLVRAMVQVTINPAPTVAVTNASFDICPGQSQTLSVANADPALTYTWWTTATPGTGTQLFTGPDYTVTPGATTVFYVQATSAAGCVSATRVAVTVNISTLPVVTVTQPVIDVCAGSPATMVVQNPLTGVTYNWTGPENGTGSQFTVNTPGVYTVTGTNALGCTGTPAQVTVVHYPILTAPVVDCNTTLSATSITWNWAAVTGATGYEVATSAAGPWTLVTTTSYTLSNLLPSTTRTLYVRAVGNLACQTSPITDKQCATLDDKMFIPNTFTPNGDGLNDEWRVYGAIINDLTLMVFNQWGQKVFEATGTPDAVKWNGRFKGEPLPVGVYVYVLRMNLKDGTSVDRKGALNLIR